MKAMSFNQTGGGLVEREMPKWVKRMGDLFEPVLTLKQKLPPLKALETLKP